MNLDTITRADALTFLKGLPDDLVNCIITSPPYYGLRDYEADGQLGLEADLDSFIAGMVTLFEEARRVLRPDGTLWLNMGDSYAGSGKGPEGNIGAGKTHRNLADQSGGRVPAGLKPKDLMGVPWRLALALQSAGWWLRSDIVWSKPNPMPGSYTDRPTSAHEYVFLMTKRGQYWYDNDAIREAHQRPELQGKAFASGKVGTPAGMHAWSADKREYHPLGRNRLDVWEIPVQGSTWKYCAACGRYYDGALRQSIRKQTVKIGGDWTEVEICLCGEYTAWIDHFATFPDALVDPCIQAGCPPRVCDMCGAPWTRVMEKEYLSDRDYTSSEEGRYTRGRGRNVTRMGDGVVGRTVGFEPSCDCGGPTRAGIVLDPFMGSGTVALRARALGRHFLGCDISPAYVDVAQKRLAVPHTPPLFTF